GACPWFNETTYAKGILPIDTYKKDLDAIVNEPLHYDWEQLRELCLDHHADNFPQQLAQACPQGIDIYYENVGGKVFDAVLPLLNT
ncbi:hypothetical protein MJL27_26590, partial [Salmonella enterica subsp. enterica serovar Anatum]|nr:hypothetical protein [Salmonella enterica subsp. enterica serovar Anatum]